MKIFSAIALDITCHDPLGVVHVAENDGCNGAGGLGGVDRLNALLQLDMVWGLAADRVGIDRVAGLHRETCVGARYSARKARAQLAQQRE